MLNGRGGISLGHCCSFSTRASFQYILSSHILCTRGIVGIADDRKFSSKCCALPINEIASSPSENVRFLPSTSSRIVEEMRRRIVMQMCCWLPARGDKNKK